MTTETIRLLLGVAALILFVSGCTPKEAPALDHRAIAEKYFEQDSSWYLRNIPFFECSDSEIEDVYYYRWKLYKAHIRNVGPDDYVITEFISHVAWDREPWCTINAASMHHIYEGRWLRDGRYMDRYIDYLCKRGGNDRRYSESIADAAYARFATDGNFSFLRSQLDSLKTTYERWSDHWDAAKNLYYIPAMPDATEYTIASIDASGGKDGFEGGEAFRPTINSYLYGNARAIARISELQGDLAGRDRFAAKAASLKKHVLQSLWNASLQHFTDRYKVDNAFVRYWEPIRGRELAGMIPWYFNLPEDSAKYSAAWNHVLDSSQLLGRFGFRTNEPSYPYYFKQFVFFQGKRRSQWNGPSWPYQSSQTLTAMANLLNDYRQHSITTSEYLDVLRRYTRQHFLPGGKINLVENYDPNNGGPIVHYYWSNHYNHSSYNNLIISGLCGIRPSEGDTLLIHPLIDPSISYFLLDHVRYHGHDVTIVYDRDGSRYKIGKGLAVYVDEKRKQILTEGGKSKVVVGETRQHDVQPAPANRALNIFRKGYPTIAASVNAVADSVYQAVDGRIWYFPEITNIWTTQGSHEAEDWIAIGFDGANDISRVNVYPFVSDKFGLPTEIRVEYLSQGKWMSVHRLNPGNPVANTANEISFENVSTASIRVTLRHDGPLPAALTEIECF